MNRVIGHLDLDYFYAQVEEVENPALKKLPVIVCVFSGRTDESGVVSTSNYRARDFGVKSGMPIYLAKRRLEGIESVIIPLDAQRIGKYEEYSARIMNILRTTANAMEQAGIDEAFFDASGVSSGDFDAASGIASKLKNQIYQDEQLTCSVGLASNKVVAKVASDYRKPDGLTVIKPGEVISFLSPLPVDKLYGVGPKTSKALNDCRIFTIGELSNTRIEMLEGLFGRKLATYLSNASNGVDDEPVVDRSESLQISRMITLKADTHDLNQILSQLSPVTADVHEKLVARNRFFKTISVIGILKDLSTHTRSKTFETPTNDDAALHRTVKDLVYLLINDTGDLRRVGVRVGDLSSAVDQSSLMEFIG